MYLRIKKRGTLDRIIVYIRIKLKMDLLYQTSICNFLIKKLSSMYLRIKKRNCY